MMNIFRARIPVNAYRTQLLKQGLYGACTVVARLYSIYLHGISIYKLEKKKIKFDRKRSRKLLEDAMAC